MPINTSANLQSIIGASIARNLNKTNTSIAVGSKNVTQKLVESQEVARDTNDRINNIAKSIEETQAARQQEFNNRLTHEYFENLFKKYDKTRFENMSKNGAFDVTNYIAPIDDIKLEDN